MNYSVVYIPPAEDELIRVWLAADDRDAVTTMAHRLEQLLRRDPFQVGESRESIVSRVVLAPPLGMRFEVIEDDKRVLVQAVWAVG